MVLYWLSFCLFFPDRSKRAGEELSRKQLLSCNRPAENYNLTWLTGVLAQLVERLNGIEEVTGSNPVGSKV